jgi:hypothetical protein
VHEVAAPGTRVAYVGYDPIVAAHARALLTTRPEGATDYLDADVRDTGGILRAAARTLDLSRPAAVLLLGVLHCIPDGDQPNAITGQLMAALAPGSFLVISHPASDVATEQMTQSTRDYNQQSPVQLTMRSHAQVSQFFAGLDLVPPGVVQLHRWRPASIGASSIIGQDHELANYGGVGRKP